MLNIIGRYVDGEHRIKKKRSTVDERARERERELATNTDDAPRRSENERGVNNKKGEHMVAKKTTKRHRLGATP
jgi:hypothetical protein